MTILPNKKAITVLALVTSLSACGGGDGGGSQSSPVPMTFSFPLDAAMSALAQTGHQFTVTGKDSTGASWTAAITMTPGSPATFEGQQAKTTSQSVTITRNGTQAAQTQDTLFFAINPFKGLGSIASSGDYSVASNQFALPASASPVSSASSPLDTIRTYKDSTKSQLTAMTTRTWTLSSDPNAPQDPVAWFCINSVTNLLPGTSSVTETDCYKLDTSGNVLAFKLTGTFGGQSLTLQ